MSKELVAIFPVRCDQLQSVVRHPPLLHPKGNIGYSIARITAEAVIQGFADESTRVLCKEINQKCKDKCWFRIGPIEDLENITSDDRN